MSVKAHDICATTSIERTTVALLECPRCRYTCQSQSLGCAGPE